MAPSSSVNNSEQLCGFVVCYPAVRGVLEKKENQDFAVSEVRWSKLEWLKLEILERSEPINHFFVSLSIKDKGLGTRKLKELFLETTAETSHVGPILCGSCA